MTSKLDQLKEEFKWADYRRDFDRLHELSKQILEIDPSETDYPKTIISSYFIAEDYENCISEYYKYTREVGPIEDDDFDLDYMLASSYLQMNEKTKAFEILDRLEESESLKIQMEYYNIIEDYTKAIEYGERLLEIDCENYDALSSLSQIYEKIGDEEWQLFYDYEACKIHTGLAPLHLIKLFDLERYEELIEKYESLCEKNILSREYNTLQVNMILGASYEQIGKYYDALKYLYRCDNMENDSGIHFLIGRNYFKLRDYKRAYKFMKDAVKKEENNKFYLRYIGECCIYLGKFMEAVEYSNRALSIDDDYDAPWLIIAAHYLENGNRPKANDIFSYLLYDSDENQDYIIEMGRNLSIIGEYDRAIKYFDTYITLMRGVPYGYIYRAEHYKRIGNDALFKKDIKTYEKLRPPYPKEYIKQYDSIYNDLIDDDR